MRRGAYLLNLGPTPYTEAWELQRSLAAGVSQGAIPDTVVLLEHPPVITLGRRTDESAELHVPEDADVEIVETDRGGKSTYHGPGQLVCYPILDLNRHGRDVKRYVRDLEEALIRTLAAFDLDGERIEGLTGVWLERRRRARSPRSASTSRAGSRRTATRSTSTSTRRRSRSGSRPAASRTRSSRRSRASSAGRSRVDDVPPDRGGSARRGLRARPRGAARRRGNGSLAAAGAREDLVEADAQPLTIGRGGGR